MHMAGRDLTASRLKDLERTVSMLNGQLRDVQCELQQAKGATVKERLWNRFIYSWQGGVFMSAVCNRNVRPNTKVVTDDHTGH